MNVLLLVISAFYKRKRFWIFEFWTSWVHMWKCWKDTTVWDTSECHTWKGLGGNWMFGLAPEWAEPTNGLEISDPDVFANVGVDPDNHLVKCTSARGIPGTLTPVGWSWTMKKHHNVIHGRGRREGLRELWEVWWLQTSPKFPTRLESPALFHK